MPGSERANARGWCSHCFEPRTVRWQREKSLTGCAAKGIDPSDAQALYAVHKTILGLLNGGKDKGFIQRIEGGPGEAVSWQIAQ